MSSWFVPLYYFSSLAGFVMVVGGIWLIYRQKIVIDRETKEVTEIETPLGKFKTNVPALALFALGFVPLIYPIVKSLGYSQKVSIRGEVSSDKYPVVIYAVVRTDSIQHKGEYRLDVPAPFGAMEDYRILYIAGEVISDNHVDPANQQSGGVIKIPPAELKAGSDQFEGDLPPVPDEFK
jgi:hypothetical protein